MLLADMGGALLGKSTAALIRAVALFAEGCTIELLAGILDRDILELAGDVDRLFDAGVLWAPEIDRIAVNRTGAYWPGVSAILDSNSSAERLLGWLGEQLGGPGTRVALYGAPPVESAQFISGTRLVLIVPGVPPSPSPTIRDELDALVDDIKLVTLVHGEPAGEKERVIRTGDASIIRAWLNADDLRAQPPEEGELAWACRVIEVGPGPRGGAGNANKPRQAT